MPVDFPLNQSIDNRILSWEMDLQWCSKISSQHISGSSVRRSRKFWGWPRCGWKFKPWKKSRHIRTTHIYIWGVLKWGTPIAGWFIMENPINNGWFGGTPIFRTIYLQKSRIHDWPPRDWMVSYGKRSIVRVRYHPHAIALVVHMTHGHFLDCLQLQVDDVSWMWFKFIDLQSWMASDPPEVDDGNIYIQSEVFFCFFG